MALPFDPSRHSYTGSHIRQRLRNLVGGYIDSKISSRGGPEATGQAETTTSQSRLVEDEEGESKVDAKDVANVQGEEKVVLYPTYARVKPHLSHVIRRHSSTSQHSDVELHVHGHVSIPHAPNTPLRRKDRILLGVARQICGLPPLPSSGPHGMMKMKSMDILEKMSSGMSPFTSPLASTNPSPTEEKSQREFTGYISENMMDDPDLIDLQIITDAESVHSDISTSSAVSDKPRHITHSTTFSPLMFDKPLLPPRSSTLPPTSPSNSSSPTKLPSPSWKNAHNFPTLDLVQCHSNLMERLAPFFARSVTGRLVTIKVYAPGNGDLEDGEMIAQRQFLTNENGHFSGKMIVTPFQSITPPQSWTIVASLTPIRGNSPPPAKSQVKFIPQHGLSLISDIDDTVKHTSILSGARELFRNTFVRDLSSMSIEGVKEWYNGLTRMGVSIHYVSNSPYQCWPIIQSFMTMAGLPMGGSVSLKQYSGMISGIWENAADKKRAAVEAIVRDFPERKFILVGDSGEQDLELYTEIAVTYHTQVLGIFIRDVTTPLLSMNSCNSSSAASLPNFFDGNGQPTPRKEGRMTLRNLRETWRSKSSETVPTLAISTTSPVEERTKEIRRLELNDIGLLETSEGADDGSLEDLHHGQLKTPLPLTSHIDSPRTSPPASIRSAGSEPSADPFSQITKLEDTSITVDDPSSRIKRVDIWKRRLARARERLLVADCGIEVWTWRIGRDVEATCEQLVLKVLESKMEYGIVDRDTGAHIKSTTM